MARTRKQLRQGTGRLLGGQTFYGTADSSGGSTTTLVDDDTKYLRDGQLVGHYILFTAGSDVDKIRRITVFTSSSGTITFTPAISAAPDSDTYEVYPFDPTLIHEALDEVARTLYPFLARAVIDESFVVGSPLWNPGFEDWTSSSVAVGWTVSGSTLARTASTLTGQYMARLTTATGYLGLTAAQRADLSGFIGATMTVYAIVKTSTTSAARLRIVDTDGTTNGGYHSASGNWELLKVERQIYATEPEKPDAIDVRIVDDSNAATIDIDRVWLEGGPDMRTYRAPGTLPHGPSAVYVAPMARRIQLKHDLWRPVEVFTREHEDEDATTSRVEFVLRSSLPSGYAMMLVGSDYLTAPTADTGNVEVNEAAGDLLEVEAALLLLAHNTVATAASQHVDKERLELKLRARREALMPRVREGTPAVTVPRDF